MGIDPPNKIESIAPQLHPEYPKDVTVDVDSTSPGILIADTYYVIVNSDDADLSGALQILVSASGNVTIQAFNSVDITKPAVVKDGTITDTRKITIKNPLGINIGNDGVLVYRLYADAYRLVGSLPNDSSFVDDTVEDISGNAELDETKFGAIEGVVQYSMSFYNSSDGTESALAPVSDEVDMVRRGTVELTLPNSTDTQVDQKRLYRIGNNLTSFTLVDTVDASVELYEDTLSDTEVEGTLASTLDDAPAPAGLAFLVEAYAMLFAAIGPYLRFTPIGQPNNWPNDYFLTYENDITGIAPVANGILVFTKTKTHLVTGTGPTRLRTQLLEADQGCVGFESVQVVSGEAIWLSGTGLCSSSGGKVRVISKDKLGNIDTIPTGSAVLNEVYYVSNGAGFVLAYDFGLGNIYKTFDFAATTLTVANNVLYGWIGINLNELFAGEPATFSYLSPRFIEGQATNLKTYKKVYIYKS